MFQESKTSFRQGVKNIFVKQPEPKELVRKWQSDIRAEMRATERQIRDLSREEKKVQKTVKETATRGDMASAKVLVKELLNTRKVIGRWGPLLLQTTYKLANT